MIELLQKTIEQLDRIVNQLRAESVENLPSKAIVESLLANTETLVASIGKIKVTMPETTLAVPTQTAEIAPTKPAQEAIASQEIEEAIPSEEESWIDRILPSFSSLQTWWDGILAKIRSWLPAPLQEKLSDWGLTGILAGIVVAVLITSVLLLPQPSAEIGEVPPETTPEAPSQTPEVVKTPPELKAPGKPEPVEIIPPPEPELTPEQSLIAAIQEQVAAITSQYPEGLVRSVEANFLAGRLLVTVGDDWYQLNPGRQDKLANSILERSRKLDFRKLEIIDSQGTLLARNPVVGNKMVILKREA
ncbi:MAG: hypothetical protein IGR93_14105 [Hydrococcus sp. C42_A2020_068]|nr:hypothetical protein [Hydrococcus sp. C42_A2020_068]